MCLLTQAWQCCDRFREATLSTYLAPIGSGFGDVLISLPVVQALLDQGAETYLVTRSFRQKGIAARVPGLAGEVAEAELRLQPGDRYLNLRAHPIQTDHLWGTPEFEAVFGVTRLEKIIALIAGDDGLTVSYSQLKPLQYAVRPDVAGKIVFVPGTDGYYKHWPESYWMQLFKELKERGQSVVMIGRPDESPSVKGLLERGLAWVETPSAADAIDVVSSARAVVSVDTGMMHVAVQQGRPTFAFIHPANYHQRSADNCFNFIGVQCPAECGRDTELKAGITAADSLEVDLKFDRHVCRMPLEENCMAGIAPQAVLSKMIEQGVVS
ncbi:MAG: hypothetical protein JST01_19355 [Cyanobacteria bacterium SZAS TMP-1]|nr:hypothetical protein [Cyanobacteria bacterium SZAS TMP-1]